MAQRQISPKKRLAKPGVKPEPAFKLADLKVEEFSVSTKHQNSTRNQLGSLAMPYHTHAGFSPKSQLTVKPPTSHASRVSVNQASFFNSHNFKQMYMTYLVAGKP
jgi:ATP-dependent phosphoenolpyruvate carboxykinase